MVEGVAAMADTSDFRNGMIINVDGQYWTIVEFQHVKPGKGGAFVRTKMKDLITGQVRDNTYRAGERVDEVRVEKRPFQYLYTSGDMFYMMDKSSFDQIPIEASMVEDSKGYLKENMDVDIYMDGETPLLVELPNFVELAVESAEPGIRGDTAQGGSKAATLETGVVVQVPLFIEAGDVIRIDTRTGRYVTRV
jgi:elongation factor P